ncbi:WS/DGAT/MGAT family O-acyltransferase [Smaragdicoccus niigatensis]|uniref:WS/DGAT/MGAT family O-acyltransferase n=1 Tax=Smaragdicoccus niigatensis TaxID=359359 RepID=UPI00037E2BA2|nr:wax ester/triacylglycerol synthase family O-acyltransferase [Smaragdicoccus niigatensis]
MVKRLNPLDLGFLMAESRESMFHVASLLTFSAREDLSPDYFRELIEQYHDPSEVQSPWNLKLKTPGLLKNPLQSWVLDKNMDPDYHVRRAALPAPGGERELGTIVSHLHGQAIDFHRPPWEMHLIEGLPNNRFALYMKVHHSLVDGYTGVQMLNRAMSKTPDDPDTPLFYTVRNPSRSPRSESDGPDFGQLLTNSVKSILNVGQVAFRRSLKRDIENLVSWNQAPQSVLNGRITRNRRFATQDFSLPLLKDLAKASGGSLNDIVLALCGGALRRFLLDQDALPEKSLIAMLPVNIRPKNDPGGGNAVGAILATLGTDIADPRQRLETIISSTSRAKELISGLSATEIMASSAMLMSPLGMQIARAVTGINAKIPINCNVVISNVPGPTEHLYFRGSRLETNFPVSIPMHGLALNITCYSYVDRLCFGFIGCRDALPHLQRLAVYTGETMNELETILG